MKLHWRRILLCGSISLAGAAWPADIDVKISGGVRAAYDQLKPQFEERTGNKLVTVGGASAGTTPTAIPARLKRGEPTDVVILTRESLDQLVKEGHVIAGSEVDLARSPLGLAVKAGAPVPDISTVDALKRALSAANTIVYYDSGTTCTSCDAFKQLGIDPAEPKYRKINSGPGVGAAVARGEADVAINQLGELLPVAGLNVVGPLPDAVQVITIFSAGIAAKAKSPAEARTLIEYLRSPESMPAFEKSGLRRPQ